MPMFIKLDPVPSFKKALFNSKTLKRKSIPSPNLLPVCKTLEAWTLFGRLILDS